MTQEKITRPILSASFDDYNREKYSLRFPLLVTPKLDGIRCVVVNGKALTRTFKPIPNDYIRGLLEAEMPDNTDMELTAGDSFNETTSNIMKRSGEPLFEAWVIDYVKDSLSKPYKERMKDLENLTLPDFAFRILPAMVNDVEELDEALQNYLEGGDEGLMLRRPDSPYKCGRSTLNECYLVKVKPFVDAEAKITGWVEQQANTNPIDYDAFGNIKRSSAKNGKVPKGALGKWEVVGINGKFKDVEFEIGTGKDVTQKMREEWWLERGNYLGKIITYKFQDFGTVDKPRLPVFKGFRSEDEL